MGRTQGIDENRTLDEKGQAPAQQRGALDKAQMIQKCGMEGEQIYRSMREVDEDASYFSVVIVKD